MGFALREGDNNLMEEEGGGIRRRVKTGDGIQGTKKREGNIGRRNEPGE